MADFSDSAALTCGLALLMQPHFKAKEHANINSRGAAAGAGRQSPAYLRTVNNGSSDAQDFGTATDACCNSERPLLSYVYISTLSIFTPQGSTQVSIPFVLIE